MHSEFGGTLSQEGSMNTAITVDEEQKMISRVGFTRLLMDGKLLQVNIDVVNQAFYELDEFGKGCINFLDLWPWFQAAAEQRTKEMLDVAPTENPKPFRFRCSDIFSPRERACLTVLMRMEKDARLLKQEMELAKLGINKKKTRAEVVDKYAAQSTNKRR